MLLFAYQNLIITSYCWRQQIFFGYRTGRGEFVVWRCLGFVDSFYGHRYISYCVTKKYLFFKQLFKNDANHFNNYSALGPNFKYTSLLPKLQSFHTHSSEFCPWFSLQTWLTQPVIYMMQQGTRDFFLRLINLPSLSSTSPKSQSMDQMQIL